MTKYKFSREWLMADYQYTNYEEVVEWCTEMFGEQDKKHDAWSRWMHQYNHKIWFRDEKDYMLFILRWS